MQTATSPFYGRVRLLQELAQGLRADPPRSYSLVGPKLIGKTRLLQELASANGPLSTGYGSGDAVRAIRIDCAGASAQGSLLARLTESLAGEDAGVVALIDDLDACLRDSPHPEPLVAELSKLARQTPIVAASSQPLHDVYTGVGAGVFDGLTQLFVGLMEPDAGLAFFERVGREWPALRTAAGALVALTGLHPYLLDRLGYALDDAQGRLAPGQELGVQHLPLIRMRLAEHGRPLFLAQWQAMQTPPVRVDARTLLSLVERLTQGSVPVDSTADEQAAEWNWLISQAIVVYGDEGYQFASPLLGGFLARKLGTGRAGRARTSALDGEASPFHSSLTKTETVLLRYFQANSNVVISPDELLADVWNRPDASPRRVQEAIRRLRLRLDEAVPPVGVIQNERGRGYRFIPAQP